MNAPHAQNPNNTNGLAGTRTGLEKETNDLKKETPNEEPKAGLGKAGTGVFFGWVGPALRNPRLLKTWIRCVLTLAASMGLLVDNTTLKTMGRAGFFAACVLPFVYILK
jgi:hypothetical protein